MRQSQQGETMSKDKLEDDAVREETEHDPRRAVSAA